MLTVLAIVSASFALMPPGSEAATVATTRFRSLDDAVLAGAVDAAVVTDVRAGHRAEVVAHLSGALVVSALAAASPTRSSTTLGAEAGRRSAPDATRLRSALERSKAALLGSVGSVFEDQREYPALPVIAGSVGSESALLRLLNAPGLGRVAANRVRTTSLSASLPAISQPTAVAAGYTGAGTYVAVIDSGADYRLPAFGSCASPGVPSSCRVAMMPPDFTTTNAGDRWDDGQPDDACSSLHGTHVSGIAAAVAPGTKLLVADVLRPIVIGSACGSPQGAYDRDILAAVDWTVARKLDGLNVVAVNMSWGDLSYWVTPCADDFEIAYLRSLGIVPVVAAGNNARSAGGTFLGDGVTSPACAPGAVKAGAVRNDGTIAPYSQSAPLPEMVFAPGDGITSAGMTKSGTSMAAPHLAGALAIIASARPDWTADEQVRLLVDSGRVTTSADTGRAERWLSMARWPEMLRRPANDDRAAAAVAELGPFMVNAYAATVEPGEASDGDVAPTRTVWFRRTLGRTGTFRVDVHGDVRIHPVAGLGGLEACTPLPGQSCAAYSGAVGSVVDVALSSPPAPTRDFTGTFSEHDSYPDDAAASPTPITTGSMHVDLTVATLEPGEPGVSGVPLDRSRWFSLDAVVPTTLTFTPDAGPQPEVTIAVRTAPSSTFMVARNRRHEYVAGPFVGDVVVQIGATGPVAGTLSVGGGSSAAYNDDAGAPMWVFGESGTITASTVGATPTTGGAFARDEWFALVAPRAGLLTVSTVRSNVDTALALTNLVTGDATAEGDDVVGDTGGQVLSVRVAAGETVLMRVGIDGATSAVAQGTVVVDWHVASDRTEVGLSPGAPVTPTRAPAPTAPATLQPRTTAPRARPG